MPNIYIAGEHIGGSNDFFMSVNNGKFKSQLDKYGIENKMDELLALVNSGQIA